MIEIRRIGPDDWKLLRATWLAALQDAPEAFESTYEGSLAFDEDEWRRRAGAHPVFLAFTGEEPVGIGAGLHDEETRPGSSRRGSGNRCTGPATESRNAWCLHSDPRIRR